MSIRRLAAPVRALRTCVLAAGLALTPLVHVQAAQANAAVASLAPHVETLANGLRVAIIENHAVPVVETAMWYGFGARQEIAGKTGLAHALAHMMYRGTPSLSGSGLDDVFTQLGAQETATTGNDFTAYHFLLPSDKLELALRVESDRMQHLILDDAAWSSERPHVLAEIDDDLASPLAKLYDGTCRAATATPICSLSPLGVRSDVAHATAQDLRTYYQAYYAPNDATLVIAGDVDTSAAMALVRTTFGDLAKVNLDPKNDAKPLYNHDKQLEIVGDFPDEVIDLAFPAPGSGDPDSGAFSIVESAIDNPRSMFHRGLVDSGYTLGYSTQLDQNVHGGLLHVFLVVAPGHQSSQARDAFLDILATTERDGFPEDLVAAAKTSASLAALYARDSIAGLANRVGYAVAVDGLADPAIADARVANASASDINVAARKYLDAPAVTAVLTPSNSGVNGTSEPPKASVSDDFSERAPVGPIVEARWVQAELATVSTANTRATPTQFTLPNGLRVLVVPVHDNPTVFVQGSLESSPRYDPPGKDGLGAMVSSLLSYGGAKYDFARLHRTIDSMGASLDLGFAFDAHARASDLDPILDMIADGFERPAFAGPDVAGVRARTLAAVAARDEDPVARANREFDSLLYASDDPILREPQAESIKAIGLADLHAFAARYLRPDLLTLTIVGDVDPATLPARVGAAFGTWENHGPRPDMRPPALPQTRAAKRYIVVDSRVVRAHLGEAAPARTSPDYYALDLINVILGAQGAYDTRLMSNLAVKRDLVYSADSTLETDRYRGSFDMRYVATPSKAAAAAERLRIELERLQRDPVGPYELQRAKSKVVARSRVAEESTETIAERVLDIGLSGLPLDFEATLPQKYDAINGATILRVANARIHPNALIEIDEGPRP